MVLTDQTKHEANGCLITWGCVGLSVNLHGIDVSETTGTWAVDFPSWAALSWKWCLYLSIVQVERFRAQCRSVVSHIHGRGHDWPWPRPNWTVHGGWNLRWRSPKLPLLDLLVEHSFIYPLWSWLSFSYRRGMVPGPKEEGSMVDVDW